MVGVMRKDLAVDGFSFVEAAGALVDERDFESLLNGQVEHWGGLGNGRSEFEISASFRAKAADQWDMADYRNCARPQVLLANAMGDWAGVMRTPYMLRRAGARVCLFGPTGTKLSRSWHIDEFVAAPAEGDAFADALFDYLDANRDRFAWVLLGNDPTIAAIARYPRKDSATWLPVEASKMELLSNKGKIGRASCRERV